MSRELTFAELGGHEIYCGCFDAAVRGRDKCARDFYRALWRNGTGSAGTKHVLSGTSSAIEVREVSIWGLSEALGWSGSL